MKSSYFTPKKLLVVALLIAVAVAGGIALQNRPHLQPAVSNESGGSRYQPLYSTLMVGQSFVAPTDSVAALAVNIVNADSLPTDTAVIIHIQKQGETQDIRTIFTTISQSLKTSGAQPALYVEFQPILNAKGQALEFHLEANSLKKATAARLGFQIDSTKYLAGDLLVNHQVRPGDLGFTLFEKPSLVTHSWRWLTDSRHRTIWIGLALLLIGLVGRGLLPTTVESSNWQGVWTNFSWRRAWPWLLALIGIVFIVYWPALSLWHWQDDIMKLVRIKFFAPDFLKIIFTNHRYSIPTAEPVISVGFYRPISFAAWPALLWLLNGSNPFLFHFGALLVFAAAAVVLFILSYLFLQSYELSFLAVLLWIVHSSKLPLAYWWSSTEDSIATLFILLTLLAYTLVRSYPTRRRLLLLISVFLLALFSKEHGLLVLFMVPWLEIWAAKLNVKQIISNFRAAAPIFAWLVVLSGFYLMVHTVAIYEPTLPEYPQVDRSYDLKVSAPVFVKNSVVYAAWSAESWLWPINENLPQSLQPAETAVESFVSSTDTKPPFYPGLLLMSLALIVLASAWRSMSRRALIIFALGWWFIGILPNLFLISAWSDRWLTLSTWSLGLLAASLLLPLLPKRVALRSIVLVFSLLLVMYGIWVARLPAKTDSMVQISRYTQLGWERFAAQSAHTTPATTVYLVGIPRDIRGSVSPYLFRLFSEAPFGQTLYTDTPPTLVQPADIVIDMRDQRSQ